MKPEDIVTSLEVSKKLNEIGLPQKSFFYWIEDTEAEEQPCAILHYGHPIKGIKTQYSAYTSSELGEILPEVCVQPSGRKAHLSMWKEGSTWIAKYKIIGDDYPCLYSQDFTEANTRANLLISLIENNLLKL